MSKEELETNYKLLARWVVDRENSSTEQGRKEHLAGLSRIEDYEKEMTARGYDRADMGELFGSIIFDGELPTYEH